uniref:Uncharacterized protein n=1 Tax=Cotesia sesamiae Kitale bracovirus TaxID=452648 RepID=S0DHB0_9VIRU|nr:conserved hypothetical protein BV1 [Cotesia sesamiae Kitale bracovirus]
MLYSKALVLFFVATIGTICTPGSSTRGLAFARPSFFDDLVRDISSPKLLDGIAGTIANVRSQIPTPIGYNWWITEKGYIWLEKKLNIPTHYAAKLDEIERLNKVSYNYVINAHNILGSVNIQHGNTIYPGSSGGKLTFGPTIVQKGNSYQIQADTEKASLNEVSINE